MWVDFLYAGRFLLEIKTINIKTFCTNIYSLYSSYLKSNNDKKFTNQIFENYLESIEAEHILE